MKYDVKKCNNLNFKLASGLSGFMKVSPKGDCYLYQHDKYWDINTMMPTPRFWRAVESAAFDSFVEDSELQIVPRNPETYTDWKVGDKVISNKGNQVNTLIAVLGKAIVLVRDDGAPITGLTTADNLTKYDKLILTDYEQELLAEREKEKCPFREGDKVLVRDYDSSEWRFAIFASYNKDSEGLYQVKSSLFSYRQCIPLNEHTWRLLGTTDEYKEEE
nr:MAG TPA: hypothetical protein [Caudoviricetes sp.]